MGTCIQKYGCKQLVSAVDALMPKMGIYEKFDVLTAIANLRILENEFIFLVMLITVSYTHLTLPTNREV